MTRADMGQCIGLLALGRFWIPLGAMLIAVGPSSLTVAYVPAGDPYLKGPEVDGLWCEDSWPEEKMLRCEYENQKNGYGFPDIRIECPADGDCYIVHVQRDGR